MNENMENEQIEVSAAENDDAILPVGWDGEGDIFEPSSWADPTAVGLESLTAVTEPVKTEPEEEETPAIESVSEGAAQGEPVEAETEIAGAETAPTVTEQPKIKFKTQYNHKELDVELDESELPTIYQKSLALDRERERANKTKPIADMAAKLAAQMGFDTPEAMLEAAAANYRQSEIDSLVGEGVHKAVAEAVVNQRLAASTAAPEQELPDEATEPEHAAAPDQAEESAPPARDFAAEVAELMNIRPELRGQQLPEEVQKAAVEGGVRLSTAYLNYEFKQIKAENERLKSTNKIHEQNAASAARAPVTGTNGGGATDTAPEDPFLAGFNSGY